MRVGIAGIGRWGKKLINTFAQHADIVMCASSGDQANRSWLAEYHPGITWVSDFSVMARSASVDAIVIATPIAMHAAQTAEALRHGKHVFVEKPLAMDATTAGLLAHSAAAKGLRLFVGHTFLFDAGIQRLLEQTTTDRVVDAQFRWQKKGTFGEPVLWTLLPHDIALALRLLRGKPAVAAVSGRPWDAAENVATVELAFEGEARASISVDRDFGYANKEISVTTQSGATHAWRSVPAVPSALDNEVLAFCMAVESGEDSVSDGNLGTDVALVLDQIARAEVHRL